MRYELKPVAARTEADLAALRRLSAAVYPPEAAPDPAFQALTWAPPTWSAMAWDDEGLVRSHAGGLLRDGTVDGAPARIGGIQGVATDPASRGQGLAAGNVARLLEHLRAEGADFALLVCKPALVPLYERLGWRRHDGPLLVRQGEGPVPFTYNLPMTHPLGQAAPPAGAAIDLLGPPW